MKGKEAKSLEEEIEGLYKDNDFIKKESDKNRKDIQWIFRKDLSIVIKKWAL